MEESKVNFAAERDVAADDAVDVLCDERIRNGVGSIFRSIRLDGDACGKDSFA